MSYFQLSYKCADCGASINYYLYTMNKRRCKRCATEYSRKEQDNEIPVIFNKIKGKAG